MKKHRLFIAINLPKEVKAELLSYQGRWPELPARWTKEDNLHITLVFLGYLSDEEMSVTAAILSEVAGRHPVFSINLKRICYGPPKKLPPKMVWAMGERSKELSSLKEDLEKSLLERGVRFLSEKRYFVPHITLARLNTLEWRRIEPDERPQVNEDIGLNFEVHSIELMESQLRRAGPDYSILGSYPLKI